MSMQQKQLISAFNFKLLDIKVSSACENRELTAPLTNTYKPTNYEFSSDISILIYTNQCVIGPNGINFICNTQDWHPIAHPWGRDMRGFCEFEM